MFCCVFCYVMCCLNNEEPQVILHCCNAETPYVTATYRPVMPCLVDPGVDGLNRLRLTPKLFD